MNPFLKAAYDLGAAQAIKEAAPWSRMLGMTAAGAGLGAATAGEGNRLSGAAMGGLLGAAGGVAGGVAGLGATKASRGAIKANTQAARAARQAGTPLTRVERMTNRAKFINSDAGGRTIGHVRGGAGVGAAAGGVAGGALMRDAEPTWQDRLSNAVGRYR